MAYYSMNQSASLGWHYDHAFGLAPADADSDPASGLLIADDIEEPPTVSRLLRSRRGQPSRDPFVVQEQAIDDPVAGPVVPVASERDADASCPGEPASSRPTAAPVDPPPYRFRILNCSRGRFCALLVCYEHARKSTDVDLKAARDPLRPHPSQAWF
jgi:hypothetical protein